MRLRLVLRHTRREQIIMPTLAPAYGRDYPSSSAALEAWTSGADFIITGIHWGSDRYCSIRDFPNERVMIRYCKNRRIVEYNPNA